jgi:shikimate dehydrogenase
MSGVSIKQNKPVNLVQSIAAAEKHQPKTNVYGLAGKKLSHSFSKEYFTKKFLSLGLSNYEYRNFEIKNEYALRGIFDIKNLRGFNITVPYKKAIIPFLDSCSNAAEEVGAVNTVAFENGKWVGYNTDVIGFENSFLPLLITPHCNALIFGTGGASAAVQYVLKKNNIPFIIVGRSGNADMRYEELNMDVMRQHNIFINTTSVGMYPDTEEVLLVPYEGITAGTVAFDLVYNPAETIFLRKAREGGAVTKNGLEMLHLQAEAAWKIWSSDLEHTAGKLYSVRSECTDSSN